MQPTAQAVGHEGGQQQAPEGESVVLMHTLLAPQGRLLQDCNLSRVIKLVLRNSVQHEIEVVFLAGNALPQPRLRQRRNCLHQHCVCALRVRNGFTPSRRGRPLRNRRKVRRSRGLPFVSGQATAGQARRSWSAMRADSEVGRGIFRDSTPLTPALRCDRPDAFGPRREELIFTPYNLLNSQGDNPDRRAIHSRFSSAFHKEVTSSTASAQAGNVFLLRDATFCRRVDSAKTLESLNACRTMIAVTPVAAGNSRG